ncbi:hypothetical protein [Synechococcus sp. CS-1328]|uniref:hypothetical protein n=1 Tax=Synechococcus sp. CS-1328 TaxID=2847976 RepID=UPI00223AA9D2|nr:hypothetical protein [Synechococcus sp. CS-1328]MCT0224352.1 hypothetical protein [Synechococcus sp. CS-1328]
MPLEGDAPKLDGDGNTEGLPILPSAHKNRIVSINSKLNICRLSICRGNLLRWVRHLYPRVQFPNPQALDGATLRHAYAIHLLLGDFQLRWKKES